MRIALLLSTLRFEDFYGTVLACHGPSTWTGTGTTGHGTGVRCWFRRVTARASISPRATQANVWIRRTESQFAFFRSAAWSNHGYATHSFGADQWDGTSSRQSTRPPSCVRFASGSLPTESTCCASRRYWTARFDVIVRSLDHPVLAVDQGLPDRREIKMLKRGSFRRCAGAIVQTESEAAKVARYGGAAERIPNAVDTGFFCPRQFQEGSHRPTVLFVGRLHEGQKRVSDVLHALARLPAQWRLEIAGSGPDRGRLEALAVELGISDRVEFLGFVADPGDLRDLYRRASVLALPSAYEGLPMVLLEAMSCATPVVGSEISAIAEVVEHDRTGLLVPVGAADRLAACLQEAVERADVLGQAARAEVLACYDQAVVRPTLVRTLSRARDAASSWAPVEVVA